MIRKFVCMTAALLLMLPATDLAASAPQKDQKGQKSENSSQRSGPRKWWIDPGDRAELGITDQQSTEIDQIFESTVPEQRKNHRELEQLEKTLSEMMKKNNTADLATVTQLVDKVESLRAKVNRTRTLMLYRINLILTPEQISKLQVMRERRDAERRKDR